MTNTFNRLVQHYIKESIAPPLTSGTSTTSTATSTSTQDIEKNASGLMNVLLPLSKQATTGRGMEGIDTNNPEFQKKVEDAVRLGALKKVEEGGNVSYEITEPYTKYLNNIANTVLNKV